jgi:nicotinate dehydrogenase subunit A
MADEIELLINGQNLQTQQDANQSLLYLLREQGLNSVRFGCGLGQCGACTVVINGQAVQSCQTTLAQAAGQSVQTVEAMLPQTAALINAFEQEQAGQCGYCLPGIVMSATALLTSCPDADDRQIRQAIDIHLCRCGSQMRILRAIRKAANQLLKAS